MAGAGAADLYAIQAGAGGACSSPKQAGEGGAGWAGVRVIVIGNLGVFENDVDQFWPGFEDLF